MLEYSELSRDKNLKYQYIYILKNLFIYLLLTYTIITLDEYTSKSTYLR